ncbi:DUF1192 family protein [Ruminococcus sp.]|nr:DUF1192 family protein [Ruminococcus sp.]MBP5431579.1 DUF1192 family protein [Ruminococcus sp.]
MVIDGAYYTEAELRAYIKQLQAEIQMLRETIDRNREEEYE